MSELLKIDSLSKVFGGVRAVDGVTFALERGQVLGLIGPNGSGKTTLLNMIAGTLRPTSGHVILNQSDLTLSSPHRKVGKGIARTFQSTRLMSDWTVRQTLKLAAKARTSQRSVEEIADIVGISDELDKLAGSLPSATQRLVMVASALATNPELLLLDEPAVGMDIDEADRLQKVIRVARTDLAVTVIVVEHNMRFLMPLADSVLVMASGRVLSSGTPQYVRNDPAVVSAYLGD
jgi:branched-chain amino acid transport system ATP-binding protein